MSEIKAFLKELITAPGLSGYEKPVREMIERRWQPLVDACDISPLGSLHALRKGVAASPRPGVLIATHMDAIGLMVHSIDSGFLHISEIGGLDPRVLPGQAVIVHGRKELAGVIVQPPAHLLPEDVGNQPVPLEYLLVDTGLPEKEVRKWVRPGDVISFAQLPLEMGNDLLAGHSLDNRASVAALTHCLELLKTRAHKWDVWAVATAQEEETLGGALTSAYQLEPQIAIAVDVTWASAPGSPDHKTFPLGEGLTLGWGPNIHPGLHKALKKLADKLEIPYEIEPMPRHSGTDAYALQIAREGIPTMVVSIPLRYMHTPVEVVSIKDIERAGRLLAEFIAILDEKTMDELTFQD